MPRYGAPRCSQPWSTIYVQWDGKVTRPCIRGPQNLGAIGANDDLLSVWNGPTYAELRTQVRDATNLNEACAACFQEPGRIIDHLTSLGEDLSSFGPAKVDNFNRSVTNHRVGHEHPTSRPVVLILDISSKCNVRCTKCFVYHSDMQFGLGHMTMDTFNQITPLLKSAMLVIGHENGESLLNKNFLAMVAEIKNNNCKFLFNTTGQLMTEERCEHLVRYGVDRIMFSIDSVNPELYERMHKGGSFAKLMQNIDSLNHIKRSYSSTLPEIGWYFVACRSNIGEVPTVVQRAYELGFSSFFISHLNKPTHEQWESYHAHYDAENLLQNDIDRAVFTEAQSLAEAMANERGMEFYAGIFDGMQRSSDPSENAPAPIESGLSYYEWTD